MASKEKKTAPAIKVKKRRGRIKIKKKVKKTCEQLKEEYKDLKSIDMENQDQVDFLKCMTTENRNQLGTESDKYPYLYPSLDDPNFNVKIATKKEFYDNLRQIQNREG